MASTYTEVIEHDDKRRAVCGKGGTIMLTRWPEEGLPDDFLFIVQGAPIDAMERIADAINAAIDAAHSKPVDLRSVA